MPRVFGQWMKVNTSNCLNPTVQALSDLVSLTATAISVLPSTKENATKTSGTIATEGGMTFSINATLLGAYAIQLSSAITTTMVNVHSGSMGLKDVVGAQQAEEVLISSSQTILLGADQQEIRTVLGTANEILLAVADGVSKILSSPADLIKQASLISQSSEPSGMNNASTLLLPLAQGSEVYSLAKLVETSCDFVMQALQLNYSSTASTVTPKMPMAMPVNSTLLGAVMKNSANAMNLSNSLVGSLTADRPLIYIGAFAVSNKSQAFWWDSMEYAQGQQRVMVHLPTVNFGNHCSPVCVASTAVYEDASAFGTSIPPISSVLSLRMLGHNKGSANSLIPLNAPVSINFTISPLNTSSSFQTFLQQQVAAATNINLTIVESVNLLMAPYSPDDSTGGYDDEISESGTSGDINLSPVNSQWTLEAEVTYISDTSILSKFGPSSNLNTSSLPSRIPLSLSCAWWNFNISDWDTRGCSLILNASAVNSEQLISNLLNSFNSTSSQLSASQAIINPSLTIASDGSVTAQCACMHLTNFALLVSVGSPNANSNAMLWSGSATTVSLNIISTIGTAFSIVCMAALILTIFWLREHKFITVQHYILVHLCLSLIV